MTFEEWLLTDAIHDGTLKHARDAAYIEGQKAMRERAANSVETANTHSCLDDADAIRALPIEGE